MTQKFMRWTTCIWNFHTECQYTHWCVMDNKADDNSENEHFCGKKNNNYTYVEHHDLTFYTVLFYFYQNLGA